MIFLITLTLLTIGSLLGLRKSNMSDWKEIFFFFSTGIFGISLFTSLIILVINHAEAGAQLAHYHELVTTIEESRNNNTSEIERAAIMTEIIETNTYIAEQGYWNNTIFDIFIPDEIAELKPIK